MALRAPELPIGDWIYEMKFDGYRALIFKASSEVRLISRNRTLFNDNYPQLVDSLKALTFEEWASAQTSPLQADQVKGVVNEGDSLTDPVCLQELERGSYVATVFPFAKVNEAFELSESRHARGKIVLQIPT